MFIHPGDYAVMKTKAAENRTLLAALYKICNDLHPVSRHDKFRARALENLLRVYEIIESGGTCLSTAEHGQLMHHIDSFLLCYNWRSKDALASGQLVYNFVTKFHFVWHICDMARWLNPKLVTCFAFEDTMGDIVKSAKACMPSTAMHKLGAKVVDNFILLYHLRIKYMML